jgi:cobalt/nickel transport system permease protein
MISEPFATGQSIIHRFDPRVRIFVATGYCFVVAFARQFPVLLVAMAVSVVLAIAAGLDFKAVVKRLILVNGLIVLLWAVVPLTYGGTPLFFIAGFPVSRAGVILSAQITLKSNAILLAFIALVATMSFATLGHALAQLRLPDKIVYLLLMNYRYIFVIEQEYQRLIRAAKIRGFRPQTNLHSYRTYAHVIGMLFVRAALRARRVHQAMLCRGFKGRFYSLQEFTTDRNTWIFLTLMSILATVLIMMEYRSAGAWI